MTNNKNRSKGKEPADNKTNNDIWDNDMVRNIRKNLTPEQIKEYERMGEYMYGDMDFEKIQKEGFVKAFEDKSNQDEVARVYEMVKSGLHPVYMELDDIKTMENSFGKKWYEKFGFREEDLPSKHNDT
jgi:hypothetical protein